MHPVLARILVARGVTDPAMLNQGLQHLLRPTMKGLSAAATVLADAVMASQRVTIIGDFDADGATSTALALEAFQLMGASNVDFLVPNRFEYGYGLTPEIVTVAAERGAKVLITVDNGISSIEGVSAAHARGLAVVITDHHLPGVVLPDAEAIVNPNQPGCDFPSKSLAGVGVVFYVMSAVRAELAERGWFERCGLAKPSLAPLLDLVALGTIADLVPLDANNRLLVQQGLKRMRAGHVRPGIAALLTIGKRSVERVVSSDLAFAVGPRLNAAGRLDDMTQGIACLLAKTEAQARQHAAVLDEMNQERKAIEASMQKEAMAALAHLSLKPGEVPPGISLYDPTWHQGVIGILAARVKERYHRPVVIFAEADESTIKGSARSIPGVHLRDVLAEVDALNPGLILKFGGHAMAAGLTIGKADFAKFQAAFTTRMAEHLQGVSLTEQLLSDGPLDSADLDLALAMKLAQAMPWGQQFEEPLFDNVFTVMNQRVLGDKHVKLVLQMPGSLQSFQAIAFNAVSYWPTTAKRVHAAYRLSVNYFRGQSSLQLMVEHAEACDSEVFSPEDSVPSSAAVPA
jgi:single-stranded-DNA-specific exonuclease